jgi:hypothetical protein
MQRYYSDFYVSVTAELDRTNDLFRAVIVIKPAIFDDYFSRTLRHPEKGIFLTDGEAELIGFFFAKHWIDHVTSRLTAR